MLNPEARGARARLAAHRRWRPGDDLDELTAEFLRQAAISDADERIDGMIDAAPRMTPAQIARIRRFANALPDDQAREIA